MEEFIEESLPAEFTNIARIGSFFIIGTGDPERFNEADQATVDENELFDAACAAFCSMLDPEGTGTVTNKPLLKALEDTMTFCVAPNKLCSEVDHVINETIGLYCLTYRSDLMPFNRDYDPTSATGFDGQECMKTSYWRPNKHSALWEECFHTVTEALNRSEAPGWSYEMDSHLGQLLKQEIDQGDYDISKQCEDEGGAPGCKYGDQNTYNWRTAVNEWVHQIWQIQAAGRTDVLTDAQLEVVEHMTSTPDFPTTMDLGYDFHEVVVIEDRDDL